MVGQELSTRGAQPSWRYLSVQESAGIEVGLEDRNRKPRHLCKPQSLCTSMHPCSTRQSKPPKDGHAEAEAN